MALSCHAEGGEGGVWMGVEMLRYAQHDRVFTLCSSSMTRPSAGSSSTIMGGSAVKYLRLKAGGL